MDVQQCTAGGLSDRTVTITPLIRMQADPLLQPSTALTEDSMQRHLKGCSGPLVSALGEGDVLEPAAVEVQRLVVNLLQQLVQVRVRIPEVHHANQESLRERERECVCVCV